MEPQKYTTAELAIYGAMIAQQYASHMATMSEDVDPDDVIRWCEEASAIVDIHREVNGPSLPPTGWQPVTKTEPADRDPNVLLACNGSIIGMLSARWTDEQDGEEYENWKVDDNLWDGDNDPTHYLRIPAPPDGDE